MKPFLLSYDRLPDVSDDTPENNPILRYREMPDFNIPPDKVITGTAKFSQDYEVALQEHLKNLQGSKMLKQLTSNPTARKPELNASLIRYNNNFHSKI